MDPKLINKISKTVYQKFPEMLGSKPKVQQPKSMEAKPGTMILIYHSMSTDLHGHTIPRHVRVVSDAKGNIIRISTSR